MASWFYAAPKMIDATPRAVAARADHAVRTLARQQAHAEALAAGATVLEADRAGQVAYWAYVPAEDCGHWNAMPA